MSQSSQPSQKAPDTHSYIDSFTHSLKTLARDLVVRCPNDATIYRAEKRIMTGIAVDPLYVINAVGPYLLRYQKEIYSSDADATEKFFLENTFDAELKASVDQEKAELVSYIIPRAKAVARTMNAAEKQGYMELVVQLLDDYIEFKTAQAENE